MLRQIRAKHSDAKKPFSALQISLDSATNRRKKITVTFFISRDILSSAERQLSGDDGFVASRDVEELTEKITTKVSSRCRFQRLDSKYLKPILLRKSARKMREKGFSILQVDLVFISVVCFAAV